MFYFYQKISFPKTFLLQGLRNHIMFSHPPQHPSLLPKPVPALSPISPVYLKFITSSYHFIMPRTARNYKPNFFYHIYNRGNNKEDVLKNADDKKFLIHLLFKNIKNTDLKLTSFCIMDNHFHLIVKTGRNPKLLSKLMQKVGVSYAIRFNKKYSRVGHVFQNRYNANILYYKRDLTQAQTYLRNNPVRKGLVKKARDYPWSKF